jgi:hypothetical protein
MLATHARSKNPSTACFQHDVPGAAAATARTPEFNAASRRASVTAAAASSNTLASDAPPFAIARSTGRAARTSP